MNPLAFFKAEYVFRPSQVLRRLFAARPPGDFAEAVLPWGAPIRVRTNDALGRIVLTLGVLDLPVTETLFRLADPGEVVADVGANLGCMTAVLARAVGPGGVVWCFEPHPELFNELQWNARRWTGLSIELHRVALSSQAGRIMFEIPGSFDRNRGVGRVAGGAYGTGESIAVDATTLDAVFGKGTPPAVLKMDVEGHELAVLQGGASLFDARRIRDCVFEEHGAYPTAATGFLEERGYKLFTIARTLTRAVLRGPASTRSSWEATSYLATTDPARAAARLATRGWRSLRGG